jgi:hypothetical protein
MNFLFVFAEASNNFEGKQSFKPLWPYRDIGNRSKAPHQYRKLSQAVKLKTLCNSFQHVHAA